ncbi:hypothetical protein BV898_19889, partial [Hypsibius exemplaris]
MVIVRWFVVVLCLWVTFVLFFISVFVFWPWSLPYVEIGQFEVYAETMRSFLVSSFSVVDRKHQLSPTCLDARREVSSWIVAHWCCVIRPHQQLGSLGVMLDQRSEDGSAGSELIQRSAPAPIGNLASVPTDPILKKMVLETSWTKALRVAMMDLFSTEELATSLPHQPKAGMRVLDQFRLSIVK